MSKSPLRRLADELVLAWVLGLIAVFGPLAVRGYRVAAESGT